MPGPSGDPLADRLVGPAMRLVGGVRLWDPAEVEAAFVDAGEQFDPDSSSVDVARALAVVCASMIPWDASPGDLLAWITHEPDFRRLCAAGVNAETAAALVAGLPRRKE